MYPEWWPLETPIASPTYDRKVLDQIKITMLWLEKVDTQGGRKKPGFSERTQWLVVETEYVSLGIQFSKCLRLDQLLGA